MLNGQPGRSLHRAKLVRQAIWRPGMTLEDIGALDPHSFHRLNPGASEAAARLEDMDAMGVDQAIVYPTLFNEYLPQVRDREAAAILARAYNDWVWELAAQGAGRLAPGRHTAPTDRRPRAWRSSNEWRRRGSPPCFSVPRSTTWTPLRSPSAGS